MRINCTQDTKLDEKKIIKIRTEINKIKNEKRKIRENQEIKS